MTDLVAGGSVSPVPASGRQPRWWPIAVFLLYTLVAAASTWPLVRDMRTRIASDPGDPALNASILVWNATTVPYSSGYWNAPHYFPTDGVTTLTENLLGMYPVSSPIYWLTRNPLLAYNLSLFLTWPLSALAVWLLVRILTRREDVALLAGLAFGFSPIRAPAFGHLQTLATFGLPFALAGMHGYLEDGRRRWLVLFGVAWLQLGLANGYYILYGGLFIGLWALYFCSSRDAWPRVPGLLLAGVVASLPLVPVLVVYRRVHEVLGLHRTIFEILYLSAYPASWFEVWSDVRIWSRLLSPGKDNMFPGPAVLVLAALAFLLAIGRRARSVESYRPLRRVLTGLVALSTAAILVGLYTGPIDTVVGGVPLRMRSLNRAFEVLLLAGVTLVAFTPHARRALAARNRLVFYAAGVFVSALLACGPVLHAGSVARINSGAVLDPAPYGWLMYLPGFNELRAPAQIKMIHLMFLAVTAAFGYASLRPKHAVAGRALFTLAALGLVADGWTATSPMAEPPPMWSAVEPAGRTEPLLELPLRPETDYGSTYRAAVHHRRVMNGVSGYDPPHYVALREGLQARDPATLRAVATLGPLDIVVNGEADPEGAIARYVTAASGVTELMRDGPRRLFWLPAAPAPAPLGAALAIADVRVIHHPQDARFMLDGNPKTGWGDNPQQHDQWVVADLGAIRSVGGVSTAIGRDVLFFPRRLAIELSRDGMDWSRVWEGPAFAETFLGYVNDPLNAVLAFPFDPREARYVRLMQLEDFQGRLWRISELKVHGPTPKR
ncbi:MAG: discoidin domain-containing protein [Vicinamibacterales bacterium]